jgi:LPPG:FO 2-phospho-L-lactate transferase
MISSHVGKRLGVICGGTGSSKFTTAISELIAEQSDEYDLRFIANVADNFWYHGVYVCPDVDITTYALSRKLDESKGWGVSSDSFEANEVLTGFSSSSDSWFQLGDKDVGLCLKRAELMQKGWLLSDITRYFCTVFRSSHMVVPASNDSVQTFVRTIIGNLHLQEFWVKNKAGFDPMGIDYTGISDALPCTEAVDYCLERVFICPANPVSSILPTISLRGFRKALSRSKVIGISPFLGDRPFSGPAGGFMKAMGEEPTSFGVAKLYSKFLKIFIVDNSERATTIQNIRDIGIEVVKSQTKIDSKGSGMRIAREIMNLF